MEIRDISSKKFAPASAEQKAEVEKMIAKLRKEGEKPIKGMFEFVDAQGGWLDFTYRFFKGDPMRTVKITHGEIVTVPMIIAKHLNNVYKKVRMMPDNLDMGKAKFTKISRTRFTPMDMLSDDIIMAS